MKIKCNAFVSLSMLYSVRRTVNPWNPLTRSWQLLFTQTKDAVGSMTGIILQRKTFQIPKFDGKEQCNANKMANTPLKMFTFIILNIDYSYLFFGVSPLAHTPTLAAAVIVI